jgi:hypothetical protein
MTTTTCGIDVPQHHRGLTDSLMLLWHQIHPNRPSHMVTVPCFGGWWVRRSWWCKEAPQLWTLYAQIWKPCKWEPLASMTPRSCSCGRRDNVDARGQPEGGRPTKVGEESRRWGSAMMTGVGREVGVGLARAGEPSAGGGGQTRREETERRERTLSMCGPTTA